jgi:hypothetical protein
LEDTEWVIKNGQSRGNGNIDEEKQNKSTTQYVMDTTIRTHTQITHIRHEASYQQQKKKKKPTTTLCVNTCWLVPVKHQVSNLSAISWRRQTLNFDKIVVDVRFIQD